ncbi:hypothetical protein ABD91_20565 [Lysinibacillus sphaericus]|uniref:hypothetical protein n=1 Tax=Lysinibacillus sphaericus TaxID=1421 RepID=UPI0018CE2F96|nr:hypothetical protein [Lysinibacillus sphaericus]MBG9693137.1 hypothetical protein [Lysinibacillus sphaericus]
MSLEIRTNCSVGVEIVEEYLMTIHPSIDRKYITNAITDEQQKKLLINLEAAAEEKKFSVRSYGKTFNNAPLRESILVENESLNLKMLFTTSFLQKYISVEFIDFGDRVNYKQLDFVKYILQIYYESIELSLNI